MIGPTILIEDENDNINGVLRCCGLLSSRYVCPSVLYNVLLIPSKNCDINISISGKYKNTSLDSSGGLSTALQSFLLLFQTVGFD